MNFARFFGKKRMIRVCCVQDFNDGRFASVIDVGDKVSGAFAGNLKPLNIQAGPVDNVSSTACRLDGYI